MKQPKARAKPKAKNKSVEILHVQKRISYQYLKKKNQEEERAKPLSLKEEEPKEEPKEKAKQKVVEKVKCPRCNKLLTAKGLQYSHKCPADKIVKPEPAPQIVEKYIEKTAQVIERIIEKEPRIIKESPDYNNIPEEIIQAEIKKRQTTAKEARLNKKHESVKKTNYEYCIKFNLNINI